MSEVMVGARVGTMDISRAARVAGFLGTDSRASVIRYGVRWITGIPHDQAMQDAIPARTRDKSMIARTGQVSALMPQEWIDEAMAAVPDVNNVSALIRYVLYRLDNYSHEEALDEAIRPMGRPKGRKDTKPRKRRATT